MRDPSLREGYRGRIAPTPTGFLHLGHAATFWMAQRRAQEAGGEVLLRIEDLDVRRCRDEYAAAAIEDLEWLGIPWRGAPIFQRFRMDSYLRCWRALRRAGWLYPCFRSRKDIAALAPHEEEPIFPPEWRRPDDPSRDDPAGCTWRFRVPDHEVIAFHDGNFGKIERVALKDFGDFVVWNREGVPAYELAVIADDLAMGITEVVRGADLLTSTARQILIHRALRQTPPAYFHCPLVTDGQGNRLAKRSEALSLRALRAAGWTPQAVLAEAAARSHDQGAPAAGYQESEAKRRAASSAF